MLVDSAILPQRLSATSPPWKRLIEVNVVIIESWSLIFRMGSPLESLEEIDEGVNFTRECSEVSYYIMYLEYL